MKSLDQLGTLDSLDASLQAVIEHFHADSGTVHLLGPDGALHLKAASRGIPQVVLDTVRTVPVGKGMAGLAVQRNDAVNVCNLQTDTSGDVRPGAKATGLEGAIVVPMRRGSDVVGAMGIANRQPRTFTPQETALLIELAAVLARRFTTERPKTEGKQP